MDDCTNVADKTYKNNLINSHLKVTLLLLFNGKNLKWNCEM